MAAVVCVAAATVAACGGSGAHQRFTVTSRDVSDPTTQDIRVLAPDVKGNWPVVVALHGVNGSGQDMVERDPGRQRRQRRLRPDLSL